MRVREYRTCWVEREEIRWDAKERLELYEYQSSNAGTVICQINFNEASALVLDFINDYEIAPVNQHDT